MHLTNYAINKCNKNFVQNNSADCKEGGGSKRHIDWFKEHLNKIGKNWNMIEQEIHGMIIKTLLCVQQSLTHY